MNPGRRPRVWPALCLALAWAAGCSAPDERPNVVVIISDDHGWPDYGFMGSDVVSTPNLDALAASGTVFSHGMSTASVCRPALQSLLTGLQPLEFDAHLAAVRRGGARVPPFAEIEHFETLPERLAERGYVSFQGGKHWEGHYRAAGFTHGMATGQAGRPTRSEAKPSEGPASKESAGRGLEARSGGDALRLGRSTLVPLLDFVAAHAAEPFLVWFAPMLPHLPHDAGPEYLALYEGRGLSRARQRYYASISRLDTRVGELLGHLEQRGLRERTLVVFLADNGWDPRDTPAAASPKGAQRAGGERGKYSAYELGFRTPIIVSWPGRLPAGRRSDRLVSSVDVVETLVELTGSRPLPPGDRFSLVPLLEGDGSLARERILGGTDPSWRARGNPRDHPSEIAWFARTPSWRYLWFPALEREELYRIDRDPLEGRDLSAVHPAQARRLRDEIEDWLAAFDRPAAGQPPGRRIRDWLERRQSRDAASEP